MPPPLQAAVTAALHLTAAAPEPVATADHATQASWLVHPQAIMMTAVARCLQRLRLLPANARQAFYCDPLVRLLLR